MSAPLVSVLMPVYNSTDTVGAAVRSLLRQTLSDLEIVVVDDGSTDGSIDAVMAAAGGDSRLRLIRAQHGGLIHALSLGLNQCRGKLLARMDADDVSHPVRLQLQSSLMQTRKEIGVCSSLVRSFPRHEVKDGFRRYEDWLNSITEHDEIARDVFVESPVAHPSVMLRTDQLRSLGGYQEHGWPEDYDLWLRYFVSGARFAKIPKALLFWRTHASRLTFTDSRYALENFMRAKAHYLAEWLRPEHQEVVVWGAGMTGRRLSKHLIREGLSIRFAVDIDSKKIGRTLRGIPIVSPEQLKDHSDLFVITAVGSQGARRLIREHLTGIGRREIENFTCAS